MIFGQSGRNLGVNWVWCGWSWHYFGANSSCFDHSLGVSVTWALIYHPSNALIDCRFANFLWFLPIFLDFSQFLELFFCSVWQPCTIFSCYTWTGLIWVCLDFWVDLIFESILKTRRVQLFRVSQFLGLRENTTGTGISGFPDFGSERKHDGYRFLGSVNFWVWVKIRQVQGFQEIQIFGSERKHDGYRDFRFSRFWVWAEIRRVQGFQEIQIFGILRILRKLKKFSEVPTFDSAIIFLVTMLTGRAVFLSYTELKGK